MEERKVYIDKLANQLKAWDDEISKWEKKAASAKTEVQNSYREKAAELRAKKDDMQSRLKELKLATGGAWDAVKTGLDKSWEDLKQSLQEARSKFDRGTVTE